MISSESARPGQSRRYFRTYSSMPTFPSPIRTHATAAPSGTRQTAESRIWLVRTYGARVSSVRCGSSRAHSGLPESRHAPTKSGPAASIRRFNSRACMSPAWFSIAILRPLSITRGRTALSTLIVSSMRASMPPGVERSANVPWKQRTIGEPTSLAARSMRVICCSAVPGDGSNAFEVGQMDRMPSSISMPSLSACSRTLRRWSSSRLPMNRISEKWTTLAPHFAQ